MNHRSRPGIRRLTGRRRLGGVALLTATGLGAAAGSTYASAGTPTPASVPHGSAAGLGQLSGQLPRTKLTEESALGVNLDKETVRLPLYPGDVRGQRVWYVLLDASDAGAADDLGVNHAPKLANLPIGDPAAVQTVTLDHPTSANNPFGPAGVHFAGAPDFSPARLAEPGRPASRWPASSPARWRDPATAPSSGSTAHRRSTTRRSWRPATGPSTSPTTRTPPTGPSECPPPARPHRDGSPSPGSTSCLSRGSTPGSRSSTSAPTPAS